MKPNVQEPQLRNTGSASLRNKIIYWATTGIIGLMMLFSAYSYFANPQVAEGFKHVGVP